MSFLQTLAAAFKGGASRVPLARALLRRGSSPMAAARARRSNMRRGAPRLSRKSGGAARGAAGGRGDRRRAACCRPIRELAALVTATSAGQSLLETLAAQLLLHGNAYVQVIKDGRGRPVELFALRPERVSVVAGRRRLADRLCLPRRREGADDSGARRGCLAEPHPHPPLPPRGRSLRRGLPGCRRPGDRDPQRRRATGTAQLLENAARPSGALVYEPATAAG